MRTKPSGTGKSVGSEINDVEAREIEAQMAQ
jgi:hypothetical protein